VEKSFSYYLEYRVFDVALAMAGNKQGSDG
jgi:hypothetical protein